MEHILNLNKVNFIDVYRYKHKIENIKYIPKRKWFFNLFEDDEGFYFPDNRKIYTREELLNLDKFIIENNSVYYKPKIVFTYSSYKIFVKYFDNKELLDKFVIENKLMEYPYIKLY